MLQSVPANYRLISFMTGQLSEHTLSSGRFELESDSVAFAVYTLVTELPAVAVLYNSAIASWIFLLGIFAVSVWNGAGFYIEVFGRK